LKTSALQYMIIVSLVCTMYYAKHLGKI